ncbi:hypothetical protein [Neptunicella marina]|uniref:Uncharacterized protein n=1 Tax=Neptunicella marina TaxID=2125989 RepID=A0A8J6M8S7_9ALTE|nr:hypothetical protein [Neptunicella marina]MBC3767871.1 hypothetical protein [Neptunicella marina]
MLRPLVKLTLVHLLWRNYKSAILTTLIAIICILVVSFVHADYVAYAKNLSNDNTLGLSFIIKWLCYISISLIWFILCFRPYKSQKSTNTSKHPPDDSVDKIQTDDPFYAISKMGKLKSRADRVIERKKEDA